MTRRTRAEAPLSDKAASEVSNPSAPIQKNHEAQSEQTTTSYPPEVLSSLTLTSTTKTHTHIIPPKQGHAFGLQPGQHFRIIDLKGEQVVDLMSWTHPSSSSQPSHSSMSYTRYRLHGSAPPKVGECIYTNLDEPMLRLTADTVKTHDMLYMACNPSFYARQGLPDHPNCAENISRAVTDAGFGPLTWNDVVDPFNVFQNTPYYSLKALGCSKAGDYVEFEALVGCVVGLSCCPFEGEGFNGGKVTEVAVVTEA